MSGVKVAVVGMLLFQVLSNFDLHSQYLVEEFRPKVKSAPHTAGHIVQDDGKIVMLGDYTFVGDSAVTNLLRFNTDGSLDTDFVLDASLIESFVTDFGICCTQASIVKGVGTDLVLLAGGFQRRVTIIDHSGQFKTDISTPTGYYQIERIIAHKDGYIAAVHETGSQESIFRLDQNGNVDPAFTRLDYTGYIEEMKVDANNNILLAGGLAIDGTTRNLVRITEAGAIDNSLNNLSFSPNFTEIDLFPDGKILLSAYTQIMLLDADANPLDTFVPETGGQPIYSSVVDPINDRILVLMNQYPLPNTIKALELDGSISEAFTPINVSSTNALARILYLNGQFVLTARWEIEIESTFQSFIVFDAAGNVDTDISTREKLFTVGQVNTAVELDDGSIVIGGEFSHIGNTQVNNLAKIDRLGNVDELFSVNNPLSVNDDVRKIEISQDNNLYVGGFFKNILGKEQNSLIKVNTEGELDESFVISQASTSSEGLLSDFIVMDDRIIASGGYGQNVMAFDFDGNQVSTFNNDIFGEQWIIVNSLCIVDEDNFAISGYVSNEKGFLWIMDLEGNIDASFARQDNIPIDSDHVTRVGNELYRSGRIIGGQSSLDANFIYKYNLETGEIGESVFSTYTISVNRNLLAINDSTVVISGQFDRFNTSEAHNFVASNFEGQAYDRFTFDVSPAINGYDLQKTVALSDDEVLLLGQFTTVNNKSFYSIALLKTTNFIPEVTLSDLYSVPEDTSFYLSDLVGIVDLDDVVAVSVENHDHVKVGENGWITLEPNFYGAIELNFSFGDPFNTFGPLVATIDVIPVNDVPSFTTSGDIVVDEDFATDQTLTVTPAAVPTGESDQTVTYAITPASVDFANLIIDSQTGDVTVSAIPNGYGSQLFTITADDGQAVNNTATQTFTLTVNAVNDAPSFENIEDQQVISGEVLQITISVNDVDHDDVAITAFPRDQTIIRNEDLTIEKISNESFIITLTPRIGIAGITSIDIKLSDETIEVDGAFSLEVLPNTLANISGNFFSSKIDIFPNPVKEILTIHNSSGFDKNTSLTVTSLAGKVVYSNIIDHQYKIELPFGTLQGGLYLLTISDDKGSITRRVIKD